MKHVIASRLKWTGLAAHMIEESEYKILIGKPEGKKMCKMEMYRGHIPKWIRMKYDMKEWTAFSWLRTGRKVGLLSVW
jgi:hypothetical protein